MDPKNSRYEKRTSGKTGVMAFLDKQGIYIVMLICLAVIGVTAYFTLGGGGVAETPRPTPSEQPVGENHGQTLNEAKRTPTPRPTATVKPTPKATATPKPTATPAATPTATVEPKPTVKPTTKLLAPVTGTVLRPYSPEQPVFYQTLNEWYVHMGVDIAAEAGTSVLAALNGTVESVVNDPEIGYAVTISHGNGKTTVYGNLASMDSVQVGDKVSRGDVIGKVGQSAISTRTEQAHVHFEYRINGEAQDPMAYMD